MAFGSIIDILFQLENLGFFNIILPFLLIFAIVYGILHYIGIFGDDKAVHAIIAVVLGLMAIRLPFFADFLTEITPRLGVGLTILLVLVILIGLFIPESGHSALGYIFIAIGAIIGIVILVQTSNVLSYFGLGAFSNELIGWVVMIAILIGIIVVVVSSKSSTKSGGGLAPWFKAITEGKPLK